MLLGRKTLTTKPNPAESNSAGFGLTHKMTYKIDTSRSLAWYSPLLGYGRDWLAQYHDNVTEWEIGSWCRRLDPLVVSQHYKDAMRAHSH